MKARVILGVALVTPLALLLTSVRPGVSQESPSTGSSTTSAPAGSGGGRTGKRGGAPVGPAGLGAPVAGNGVMAPPMMGGRGGMPMGMGMGTTGTVAFDPLLEEDFQLENQIQQILQQFDTSADAESQGAARKNVAELLDRQFTVRQERREHEIAEIEARVKRLREALDKRAQAKPQIIERRLNDLFSDAEGLGWGEVGGAAGQGGMPGLGGLGARSGSRN